NVGNPNTRNGPNPGGQSPDLCIEIFFRTKIVVYRGNIGMGFIADIMNSSIMKAFFCEYFGGGF
ncbi:MAG TPA: hypothetical protein P5175_08295, partial [Anaerohalosphaeraceae bacterium]|nr:hypothetical protein [Anaerohalosphaeraceae bacterium]HPC64940.1 hypothetical protein [Anaerohalosphaeraceae bacterium]HRS71834.1 hypothetical protein [Anaerohalosphaeraceae bacterium]HRV20954.1 hypothetical protein [Anaerohalosphaeraceae bacterium]